MEVAFKILFVLAGFVFCITVIGVFLIIVKIILMFQPQVNLMGLIIS
ncbi:MAG: hypothetical protein NTY31_02295 [Candidatus Falkowbacteria bacterium]|nr:hypothetical protein [Candidatus Falkowbacteria bacterium]